MVYQDIGIRTETETYNNAHTGTIGGLVGLAAAAAVWSLSLVHSELPESNLQVATAQEQGPQHDLPKKLEDP